MFRLSAVSWSEAPAVGDVEDARALGGHLAGLDVRKTQLRLPLTEDVSK